MVACYLSGAPKFVPQTQTFRIGDDLTGRTLGVLGVGNIGGAVARIGKAFGMEVIAWSQNLTAKSAAEAGAALVSKDELFRQADILTIHLVLSSRTRGLVGAKELGLMKPTSRLVNTSRGPIVVEADLIAVLRSGKIAGAALLERRATTKTMKTRACVIDFLSCISYTGTSYPDWVSS